MSNLEKTLMELHGMLKSTEKSIVKPHNNFIATLLTIREGGLKRKKIPYPKIKEMVRLYSPT